MYVHVYVLVCVLVSKRMYVHVSSDEDADCCPTETPIEVPTKKPTGARTETPTEAPISSANLANLV